MAGGSAAAEIITYKPIAEKTTETISNTPIADKLNYLVRKSQELVTMESVLGKVGVTQIKVFIGLCIDEPSAGKSGANKLAGAEKKLLNWSGELADWLEKVNGVIALAADVLDECEYHKHLHREDSSSKFRNYLSSVIPASTISDMAGRFKCINSRLKAVLEEGDKFGDVTSATAQAQPSKDSGEIKKSQDGEKNKAAQAQTIKDSVEIESQAVEKNNFVRGIVDELLRLSNKDLSFISLVGWGATGKTALAKILYKRVDVNNHFDERMWVQVSVDLDVDRIARCMLATLIRARVDEQSSEALNTQSLQERIKGRRYLLVLDDVWEESSSRWDLLVKFLHSLGGSRGSKVVVTTCIKPVARLVDSHFTHNMRLNSVDYCTVLFDMILSAGEGSLRSPAIEEMVRMCRGNPLYIKMLGCLMCSIDESMWPLIAESKRLEDFCHGIPSLCFQYIRSLPLKQCFQYCCIFPKGYLMGREELVHLWMAQGYLNPRKGDAGVPYHSKMEDVGVHYYNTLLKSSLLQVAEDNDFDTNSCKMHDLLRGMLLSATCKGGFRILENEYVRDTAGVVHLSLLSCKVHFSKALRDSFSNLVTLRLENCGGLGEFLDNAKGLRVLIVVDWKLEELPISIGTLVCLKYLDISRTKIVRLPEIISGLYNLQTLRLYDLLESPRNFDNLVSLRNLYVRNFMDSMKANILPLQLRGLVNLWSSKASLKVFLDSECKIENIELRKNPNFMHSCISIHQLEYVTNPDEASKAQLLTMHGLDSIKLHWSPRRENSYDEDVLAALQPHPNVKTLMVENYKGTKFPFWMVRWDSAMLPLLVNMELENCCWCEELPPLGQLPHLRTLKIVGMGNVHYIAKSFYGTISADDLFPSLKELSLFGMSNLEKWDGLVESSSKPAFPYLERLQVEQCPKLKCIPDIILQGGHMVLRKLRIALCDSLTGVPKRIGELNSLEDLEIIGLPLLEHLSIGSANILKSLTIGCFATESDDNLHSTQTSLHLRGSTDAKDLPEQLQHLSALTNLTVWGYRQLEALPEWLAKLSSLQVLKLESCGSLKYFPPAEKMQQMACLKELNICYCPLLEERCTRGSRPEWHKISRVPTIVVNYETIHQLRRPA